MWHTSRKKICYICLLQNNQFSYFSLLSNSFDCFSARYTNFLFAFEFFTIFHKSQSVETRNKWLGLGCFLGSFSVFAPCYFFLGSFVCVTNISVVDDQPGHTSRVVNSQVGSLLHSLIAGDVGRTRCSL